MAKVPLVKWNIKTILKSIMQFISINTPTENCINQTERKPTIHSISINWKKKYRMEIRSHNLHYQLKDWRLKYFFRWEFYSCSYVCYTIRNICWDTSNTDSAFSSNKPLVLKRFQTYIERVYSRQLNVKPLGRILYCTIPLSQQR